MIDTENEKRNSERSQETTHPIPAKAIKAQRLWKSYCPEIFEIIEETIKTYEKH